MLHLKNIKFYTIHKGQLQINTSICYCKHESCAWSLWLRTVLYLKTYSKDFSSNAGQTQYLYPPSNNMLGILSLSFHFRNIDRSFAKDNFQIALLVGWTIYIWVNVCMWICVVLMFCRNIWHKNNFKQYNDYILIYTCIFICMCLC